MKPQKQNIDNPVTVAEEALRRAEHDVLEGQQRIAALQLELRERRKRVAEMVSSWQTISPRMTDAQMRRQFIASEQERKRDIAAGKIATPQGPIPGNSVVDRTAVFSAGARRGARNGGGDAFRRGSQVTRGLRLPSER